MGDEEPKRKKRKEPPSPSYASDDDELSSSEECEQLSWRSDPESSHSDWTIEIIVAGEKTPTTYNVHCNIIGYGPKKSEYFGSILDPSKGFAESQSRTSRIELEKIAADAFPAFLDYLYAPKDQERKRIKNENAVALKYLVSPRLMDVLSMLRLSASCAYY